MRRMIVMIRILKATAIFMKLLLAGDSNQRTVIKTGDNDDGTSTS